jgi:hypothetical protein
VLIYRALTWVLPILVGIGCYLWWRRQSLVQEAHDEPSPAGAGPSSAPPRRPGARDGPGRSQARHLGDLLAWCSAR